METFEHNPQPNDDINWEKEFLRLRPLLIKMASKVCIHILEPDDIVNEFYVTDWPCIIKNYDKKRPLKNYVTGSFGRTCVKAAARERKHHFRFVSSPDVDNKVEGKSQNVQHDQSPDVAPAIVNEVKHVRSTVSLDYDPVDDRALESNGENDEYFEEKENLQEAMDRLKDKNPIDWRIIFESIINDHTQEKIAEIIGRSQSYVSKREKPACSQLREILIQLMREKCNANHRKYRHE